MPSTTDNLLLVTHVPIRQGGRGPQIDDQTAAGIEQWCKHFEKVTYIGVADDPANPNASSASWVDMADRASAECCELIALPRAYRVGPMMTEYLRVRTKLRDAVAAHRHLCFTFGGFVGDWPSVAAREALRQARPYAAWLDRVEPGIVTDKLRGAPFWRRLVWAAARPLVEQNIRHILRGSSVALLQGLDTFEYYAELCRDPHCTYDTHTQVSDQISPACLSRKQARICGSSPINIVYVGRAAAMKGPDDWLATLERLSSERVPFKATWVGDGPELPAMKEKIAASPLAGAVHFHGFEGDRRVLLRVMREGDIFLFCHKTSESPRCLIEALVSGCPLVGYDTAYPRGLIQERGGGVFAPQDDIVGLAHRVLQLHRDRPALARLAVDAASSGELYNEDRVYEHRAFLMKRADSRRQDATS